MPNPEAPRSPSTRRRLSPAAIAARVALYFVAGWGTIAVLAAGLFPGALWVTLALALYCIVPFVLLIRWRGWPFYPSAAFRLLVVRPVLYGNLMLPLVAGAGLIGLLGGATFRRASMGSRSASCRTFISGRTRRVASSTAWCAPRTRCRPTSSRSPAT